MDVTTAEQGGTITITGQWNDPSTAALTLVIDQLIAVAPAMVPPPTRQTAAFKIPNLGVAPGASKVVGLLLSQSGQTAAVGNLSVSG
jgi:hypothetical protein